MISEIRRFTDEGNSKFRELLVANAENVAEQVDALSKDEQYSRSSGNFDTSFEVPRTRLELGATLHKHLGVNSPLSAYSRDPLMWNWISAALLKSVIATVPAGKPLGAIERWALSSSTRRYYRHIFAGAYLAYEAHADAPEKAMALLFQDLLGGGEMVEQLQATPDIAFSVCAEVATILYYDAEKNQLKSGSSSKGEGTVRRLTAAFLNQILLTVDVKGMKATDIIELLPPEFDRFRAKGTALPEIDQKDPFSEPKIDPEQLRKQLPFES
jgi:hypothetical protein